MLSRALERPNRPAMMQGDHVTDYQSFLLNIESRRRWFEKSRIAADSTVVLLIGSQTQSWLILLALRALGARTISISNLGQIASLALNTCEHLVLLKSEHDQPDNAAAVKAFGLQPLLIESGFDTSTLCLSDIDATVDTCGGGHIVYTSGTTGTYKKLSIDAELDYQVSTARAKYFGYTSSTVFGDGGLGLWTAIGYKQPLAVWAAGGCVLFPVQGRQWADFNRYQVTHAYVIPSGVTELLHQVDPTSRLNSDFHLSVGAGFLSERVTHDALSKLTKKLSITYGSTELCLPPMQVDVSSSTNIYWYRPTSSGRVEIVGDDGENCPVGQEGVLRIKLSVLDYHAYLDDEDATQRSFRDGYFYPGDMAVARSDGLIKVTGRVSDVLVVGGQKIATSPIEQSLQKLLQVSSVPTFFRGERADLARNPDLNSLRVA